MIANTVWNGGGKYTVSLLKRDVTVNVNNNRNIIRNR